MKTVTEVNVHEHLKLAKQSGANQCFLEKLYTRDYGGKARFEKSNDCTFAEFGTFDQNLQDFPVI
jgi:hypothetical protein